MLWDAEALFTYTPKCDDPGRSKCGEAWPVLSVVPVLELLPLYGTPLPVPALWARREPDPQGYILSCDCA